MTAYISRDDSEALAHYGVKGMRWHRHLKAKSLFDLFRSQDPREKHEQDIRKSLEAYFPQRGSIAPRKNPVWRRQHAINVAKSRNAYYPTQGAIAPSRDPAYKKRKAEQISKAYSAYHPTKGATARKGKSIIDRIAGEL